MNKEQEFLIRLIALHKDKLANQYTLLDENNKASRPRGKTKMEIKAKKKEHKNTKWKGIIGLIVLVLIVASSLVGVIYYTEFASVSCSEDMLINYTGEIQGVCYYQGHHVGCEWLKHGGKFLNQELKGCD